MLTLAFVCATRRQTGVRKQILGSSSGAVRARLVLDAFLHALQQSSWPWEEPLHNRFNHISFQLPLRVFPLLASAARAESGVGRPLPARQR